MSSQLETVRNNYESKCSMKVETNSRGFNTTVHVYEGCTQKQIDQTAKDTVYAHLRLQDELDIAVRLEAERRGKNND